MNSEELHNSNTHEDKPGMHLFFRPIFSKDYGAPVGFQSKLYLIDEENGIITPETYNKAFDSSNTCMDIILWELEAICRLNEGFIHKEMEYDWIAVEIMPQLLERSTFIDEIMTIFNRNRMNIDKLAVQLPVEILDNESQMVRDNLDKLRELDCKIIINGYGSNANFFMELYKIEADYCIIEESLAERFEGDDKQKKMFNNLIKLISDTGMAPVISGLDKKMVYEAFLENDLIKFGIGNRIGNWFAEEKLGIDRRRIRYIEFEKKNSR